ncbi:glycine--tRNA ligase subunit beta [Maricaulaceae bacterium MS644]
MSDFLLEFFSEEIPARMQARAEADLERLFTARLKEAGLEWSALETFSGPRRIGLSMTGLPDKTADVSEERKGPRTDAPEKALEGFLRGAGLTSLDQCRIEENKKGAFYIAVIEKPGRNTADVIAEAIPEMVKAFPWPKSMKFGEGDRAQRWVRPLQRIVALLGGEIVPAQVFGITASNVTEGHRIHGSGPFAVSGWDDYQIKLKENGVLLSRTERRAKILLDARKVCADAGLVLVEDDGLLDEVTGLVEHPVAILGDMDPGFLDLPPEVIQLTMKTHQKYFAVADSGGKIAPKFVVIANQDAPDGGAAIAAGNARVLSARLSDARHFWDLDRAKGLEAMAAELSKVTFHDKLGTVADKTERVAALARELAPAVGADPELAYLAAKLAKADLVSQMVYEFPELQGVMGRYYALEADPSRRPQTTSGGAPQNVGGGEQKRPHPEESAKRASKDEGGLSGLSDKDRQTVADAIRDHYKPQGPSDAVPTAPVSAAVALADKLDTLVGFWAIDEKPTGSKDPFALRRAALGVIRILLEVRFHEPSINHFFRTGILKHLKQIPFGLILAFLKIVKQKDASRFLMTSIFDAQSFGIASAYANTDDELVKTVRAFVENCRDWPHPGVPPAALEVFQNSDAFTALQDFRLAVDHLGLSDRYGLVDVENADGNENSERAGGLVASHFEWMEDEFFDFFADRLKVHLKDEGVRHDVIDAVFALGDDDLVRVTNKSRALQAFLETEDGAALLAGYRRAANILAAEEKKGFDLSVARLEALERAPDADGEGPLSEADSAALFIAIARTADAAQERALIAELEAAEAVATAALAEEDFESAMAALSKLRRFVDGFFEAVVVNAEDRIVRRNRLLLLSRIRAAVDAVADFSRLEG